MFIDWFKHPLHPHPLHDLKDLPTYQRKMLLDRMPPAPVMTWDSDFKGFTDALLAAGLSVWVRSPRPADPQNWRLSDESSDPKHPGVFLMSTYQSGGTRGSMGGDVSTPFVTPQEEIPDFSDWSTLLAMCWPDIPFHKERRLRQLTHSAVEWSENEYYGDSSLWRSELVDLSKLYQILKLENKVAVNPVAAQWDAQVSAALSATPLITVIAPPVPPKPSRGR